MFSNSLSLCICVLQTRANSRLKRSVAAVSSIPQGSITLPSTLTQNLTSEEQNQVSRLQFNFYQKSTLFQVICLTIFCNSGCLVYIMPAKDEPCFLLADGSGGWNSNGCIVQNTTDNETICGCNHLTSFAILLPTISLVQNTILTFITYIGCGVSAIFLSLTLLTYLAFGKLRKDIPSKILIELCFALLFLNLVFLVDAWLSLYPDAMGLCISTAWFLHYFLLVVFTWMGLEGVHMYLAIVKVFNNFMSHYMLKFSLVGWGVPMLVVIIVIAIDKNNYGLVSYGKFVDGTSDDFCWLKNDIAFYVAVVAYFCVIFVFNFIMFIIVLVQLHRVKNQNPHNNKHRTTIQDVRSVIGISILLGLTWGFAFFAWGPLNLAFMYLFAIFNSLQGFFIFVFHCAVKETVRRQWRTYLCCGRMRLLENSGWTNFLLKCSDGSKILFAKHQSSFSTSTRLYSTTKIVVCGSPIDD
uniref:Si:dkey-259j3.5 n=1 Tax=Nothobranchius furzeri TaxID=105023 RepID=A0A8C6VYU3_NOTFU